MGMNNSAKTRIGIVTYSKEDNLGAMLQAASLQSFLNLSGFSSLELNASFSYQPIKVQTATSKEPQESFFKRFYRHFLWKKRHAKFENFRKSFLEFSPAYSDINRSECLSDFDYFLTGSDQVWNVEINKGNPTFFLSFCPSSMKKTYGVSFGYSLVPEAYRSFTQLQLKGFKNVLVREDEGSEILRSFGIDSKTVLDPVFLASSDFWDKLKTGRPLISRPYALFYVVAPYNFLLAHAQAYCQKHNLLLVVVGNGGTTRIKGAKNLLTADPKEFVSLLSKANVIFTTSFHGLALSLIFRKNVAIEISTDGKALSSRLTTLLKKTQTSVYEVVDSSDGFSETVFNNDAFNQAVSESKTLLFTSLES
jgi:hypothetical protein